MEIKEGALVFIIQNDKVLLCKKKDDKFWGGIFADVWPKGQEDLMTKTSQFLSNKFGVASGEITKRGSISKRYYEKGKLQKRISAEVLIVNNVQGNIKNDDYDLEWVGIMQVLTKPLDGGDVYWVPLALQGKNVRASFKYSATGNLLTFESSSSLMNFSLGRGGRGKN